MNWAHAADMERERPFFTGGLTTTVLAGGNTWALCVWCPRAAAPGSTKEKVEKTPLVPRDGPINQTVRNWSRSAHRPRGTRSSECSDDYKSRVRSCRRATNNSREEVGLISHAASTANQGQKVYKLNGLEALGNKASPRERCPRGQRRRCPAQAVQAWMDSREKKQTGKDPRTQESKRA